MIILIQINYSEDHAEKILPLGILSVGSALKKNGFLVKLININETEIEQIATEIAEENPEFVGLSVMTGMQTRHSAEFSKKLKDLNKQIKILWGGIHPSLLPEQCLNEDYIDFVIIGEGEETAIELAQAIQNKGNYKQILGLGYKDQGQVKINPRRPLISDLDQWRLDFSLLNMENYVYPLGKYQRVIAYKTSRGCPYQCAFCYNHEFNQGKWRTWSIKTVIEDINYLKEKYKIEAIKFYDDNFFVNKNRALEILQAINLPSHVEVRIDVIDDALAAELQKLKIFDMLIGLESGSNRILELIDKRFTVDRLKAGVEIIKKYNLHATYSFIVGLPTETKEEFQKTIDLMYEIFKIHPQAGFTLGVYLPYPGSRLYQFSLEHGFCPPARTYDWGEIDRFRKNFKSPWINAKKVWAIRECFKIMSWEIKILKKWFEFRVKHNFYLLPWDIYLVEFLADLAIGEKNFIGRGFRKLYNFIRLAKTNN